MYAERWDRLVAEGMDIDGEARLMDAMAERGSRILDAGCGQGRVGGRLAACGHHVTGVDIDEYLIGCATEAFPEARWEVQDLATLDLRMADGARELFDLVVSAGNVMTFLAETERRPALASIAEHLAETGRAVIGFGAGRGWSFADFELDAQSAGLQVVQRFGGWDLRCPTDDFQVTVLMRADAS